MIKIILISVVIGFLLIGSFFIFNSKEETITHEEIQPTYLPPVRVVSYSDGTQQIFFNEIVGGNRE